MSKKLEQEVEDVKVAADIAVDEIKDVIEDPSLEEVSEAIEAVGLVMEETADVVVAATEEVAEKVKSAKLTVTKWWKDVGEKMLKQGKSENRIYMAAASNADKEFSEVRSKIDRTKSVQDNCKSLAK